MDNDISEKKIIAITGTSSGIGEFLTHYYLNRGHTVIGFSRREVVIESANYTHFCLDVRDEGKVIECFGELAERFKYIDVLINNSGIASMNHCLLTSKVELEQILSTNVLGTFLFTREAARLMRKSKNPRVVNFTTAAVPLNIEGEAAYVSSKAAVESLSRVFAKELAPFNITVNLIGPSLIETALTNKIGKDKTEALINSQSIKRIGTFEDVANVINFFIAPESGFITGQTIYLGGVF